MMPDIFSSFDPYMSSALIPLKTLFLMLMPASVLLIMLNQFSVSTRIISSYMSTLDIMFSQLSRTLSLSMKGLSSLVTSVFMVVILLNLAGLTPYSFSSTSHLITTLSLGLPMWLSLIISSFKFKPKASTAHFLPDGAPDWLNPFLVLIESTSVLVRPLTLSFRLAANMTAGHIVLSLLGIYLASAMFTSMVATIPLLLISSFYVIFEVAICVIQAYIFCLLVSLYSDDHAH